MDDQTNSVLIEFLDTEAKFHYSNYYYQNMTDDTGDEKYLYKLECLYEWWGQEEPFLYYNPEDDRISYPDSETNYSEYDDD